MRWCAWFGLLALFAAGAARPAGASEVMVFAAVSLTEALQENAAAYEKATGDRVVFNFGASSLLARQIQEGAPADVFFSADEARMDDLEKKHRLISGTRRSLLSNVLVVVVEADAALRIDSARDLAGPQVRHLAIAEPSTVPAGVYAKQYLKSLGLWTAVIDKVVPMENVRAALAAVESGNCEAGIVYKTDAQVSKKVQVAMTVPRDEGPRISYPVAAIAGSRHEDAARRFLEWLGSDGARAVFTAHGFLSIDAPKP